MKLNEKNNATQNAFWIISCRIIQSLLGFLIGVFSARYLGPSNYGLIHYAVSVVAFLSPIMKLGFNHILVQDIVNEPENEGEILGSSILFSMMSSLLAIIGVAAFVNIANPDEPVTICVTILYSISLFFQATEMFQYWFQAKLLSQYVSLISLLSYIIVSAYKIFLLVTEKSVYWFAVSYSIDSLMISVGLVICYNKLSGSALRVSFKRAKEMFQRSKYFVISSIMITIYAQTDKIMLKGMIGEYEVGLYSAAVACAGMTGFVFSAIIESAKTVIFENHKHSDGKYKESISLCYSIVIFLSLIQSVFITVLSPLIVKILYGNEYLGASKVLRIIVWYTTFSYVGSVRDIWILAEGKNKFVWIINLSGACCNIILNLLLIPLMGMIGAAIASLITQIFNNVIINFIIKPIRYNNTLMLKGLDPRPLIGFTKMYLQKLKARK